LIRLYKFVAIIAVFWLSGAPSLANVLRPVPIRRQAHESHAIVLARARQNDLCSVNGEERSCVFFEDAAFLLRRQNIRAEKNLIVIMNNGIDEAKVSCCEAGKTYVMFLVKYRGNYFLYHGRWSIFRSDPVGD
jgi:hypothetical protein